MNPNLRSGLIIGLIAIVLIGAGVVAVSRSRTSTAIETPTQATSTATSAATSSPTALAPVPQTPVSPVKVTTVTHTTVTTKPQTPAPIKPSPVVPAQVPHTTPSTESNPGVPTTANELRAASIPLLAGGSANLGQTVPIMYLQVENQSTSAVTITGIRLTQGGTAADESVTGFSAIDEQSTPLGAVGSGEGSTPLVSHTVVLPMSVTLAPAQRKLFTIKARVSATAQAGGTLAVQVSGISANIRVGAAFPIRGTTYVIGQ